MGHHPAHLLVILLISFLKDEDKSGSNKKLYYSVSKELSELGSKMIELSRELDEKVNQRIQTLGDMVVAYTDMMDRHDKGLLKEHKVNKNVTPEDSSTMARLRQRRLG